MDLVETVNDAGTARFGFPCSQQVTRMKIRQSWIPFAVGVMVWLCWGPVTSAQDEPLSNQTLIKRLGSADFTQRQSASKTLFERGPAVLEQLKQVPLSSNPELNQRVSELIKLLSNGVDAQSAKETFDAVLTFEDAEAETRKQLLKRLLDGEQYDVYFRLIERLPVEQAEDIFYESRLRHLIPTLCEKEQWDDVQTILSHRLTWQHEPNLCAIYHRTMGTLDVYLDKMKREIDNAEFADATRLATLIGLLKAEKDYDTALRYAKRFGSADLINAYHCQILMESGNWEALADIAVLGDEPIDSDRYFLCNRMTYPMVKFWGGSPQEFLDALEEVTEKSIIAQEDKDAQEDAEPGLNDDALAVDPIVQQIHLLTLNWDQARKGIKIGEDQISISLLGLISQYQRLLDELNVGSDFTGHQKWATQKQQAIENVAQKFSSLRVRSNPEERRELIDEIESKLDYYMAVCDVLADLGMEVEATLFIRQLYQLIYPFEELSPHRLDLIGRVADYGDAASLWEFIENAGLNNAQLKSLVFTRRPLQGRSSAETYVLFGHKNEVAQFVYKKLADQFDDPLKLIKHVAYVVDYQLKPAEISSAQNPSESAAPFNLDTHIALMEHNQSADECWNISQIYAFHQRPQHQQWLQRAALKSDMRAIKQIARTQFNNRKYLNSARMFEREFELSYNPLSLSRAAEAYGLAGDTQKSKRLHFHAFVLPDFIYDNGFDETYGSYLEEERSDLIADQLLFRIATTPQSNSTSMVALGWQVLQKPDPVAAANLLRIRLLSISSNNAALRQLALAITSHTLDATADVIKGHYAAAERTIDRLLKISPATPSIAEQTVVQLDRAGQHKMGDDVIKKLATAYQDLMVRFPTSATHCNNFAWSLACGKRHAQVAIRHAQTAVARRPHNPGFIDTLAESHFAAGDYDKAIQTIDRAVAIEPENAYYRNQRLKYETEKTSRGNK